MIELPISDYMKEICAKEGRVFTDRECAAIIFNSWMPQDDKETALRTIQENTSDELLKEKICAYFTRQAAMLEQFKKNDEYPSVYLVSIDIEDTDEQCYATFEAAFQRCCSDDNTMHIIEKYPLCGEKKPQIRNYYSNINPMLTTHEKPDRVAEYQGGAVSAYKVFADGLFQCMYSFEPIPDLPEDPYWFFNNTVVVPPNPFERGDIVEFDGDVGVVETSQESWHEFLHRASEGAFPVDYSDMSIAVETVCEDGSFVHSHISPMLMTPASECSTELETVALTFAAALLHGQVSLDYFLDAYERKWKLPSLEKIHNL